MLRTFCTGWVLRSMPNNMKEKIESRFRSEILGVSDVDLNTAFLMLMIIGIELWAIGHSLNW